MNTTFSIRELLLVTIIAALCTTMLWTSHWLSAAGFGIASAVVMGAWRGGTADTRGQRLRRMALILVCSLVGWVSVVDLSSWYEWCHHCTEHRFVHAVRVCGLPLWHARGHNHVGNLARLRSDLGFPCSHQYERQHLVRVWGFVYARPAIGITCCLSGNPSYYDDGVSERVRDFACKHPEAARRLCEHIVNQEDYDEMHAFIITMKRPGASWNVNKRYKVAESQVEPVK